MRPAFLPGNRRNGIWLGKGLAQSFARFRGTAAGYVILCVGKDFCFRASWWGDYYFYKRNDAKDLKIVVMLDQISQKRAAALSNKAVQAVPAI